MKKYLLLFLLLIPIYSFSQTEIWRIRINWTTYPQQAIQGDSGSIYLTPGVLWGNASLIKISSINGNTIWEKSIPDLKFIFSTKKGIYLIKDDSIVCLDHSGNFRWGRTRNSQDDYNYEIDKKGNIFFLSQSHYDSAIYVNKLDTLGISRFKVALPNIPIRGEVEEDENKLLIDESGGICIVRYFVEYIEKETDDSDFEAQYRHIYAYRVDGQTGSLISRSPLVRRELIEMLKWDKNSSTDISVASYYDFKMVGNNLIGCGTKDRRMAKETLQAGRYESLSNWQILNNSVDRKTKLFKYAGKGIDVCKDGKSIEKDDLYLNGLGYQFLLNTNDAIIVPGSIAVGKSNCGVPGLSRNIVLTKYSVKHKKLEWIKIISEHSSGEIADVGGLYISASNKIFIRTGKNVIKVFDSNGNLGNLLTFSDNFWTGYIGDYYENIRAINTEEGFIYLWMLDSDTGEPFFAKYSIPTLNFISTEFLPDVEEPKEFTLYQNYPEPFNPTTTIRFVLPEQSLVSLKVYNMLGQEIANLIDQQIMEDGEHEVEFNAQRLASGVYFYRIVVNSISDDDENMTGNQFTSIKKMLLIR